MTLPRSAASAVAALDPLVTRLAVDRGLSAARTRQLRWVAGELELACAHPEFPTTRVRSVRTLLDAEPVSAYLELARRGELRRRAVARPAAVSDASMRVRADCLRLFGEAAGVMVTVPDRPGMPEPRDTVDSPSRGSLLDFLERRADRPDAPAGRVRLFAIVGVVLDTGARVGELCAMRLEDVDARRRSVRVTRKPQARSTSEPTVERVALSAGTGRALRAWLEVREDMVRPLQGGAKALWVSIAGNHAGLLNAEGGSVRRPPGMPLRPRGLQRAYVRGVQEANLALAGTPGWQPLPIRLEQLRRAVEGTQV
jgi:integrase